jgi:hypothetical protein
MQRRGLLLGYKDSPSILYQCNIIAKCSSCKSMSYIDYYRGKYDYDNDVTIQDGRITCKCGGTCKVYSWNQKNQYL